MRTRFLLLSLPLCGGLLACSPEPGAAVRPRATLTEAVIARNLDAARAMLKAGANPNVIEPEGNAPLIIAAAQPNEPMLRLLLSYGADPNLKNSRGRDALSYATDPRIRALLVSRGVKGHTTHNQYPEALR